MVYRVPHVRWGVVGTGWIATQFVKDITVARDNARAQHTIQAVGSSSLEKGTTFVKTNLPESLATQTKVYDSYDQVYNDPDVDVVYVATPHVFHKRDCLNAIAAGKHVLCEKPFMVNEKDAQEVVSAAKEKGVYILEGFWTRFLPLVRDLQRLIHSDKIIGNVHRVFCDFGMAMNIRELPITSRLRDRSLGAGALLDIGVYSLMWGTVVLGSQIGEPVINPNIVSSQTVANGIDLATTIVISYPETGSQGILTCSTESKSSADFCRIEGSKGTIIVNGPGASIPTSFTVHLNGEDVAQTAREYSHPGFGLHYEADAVALDIAAGKSENEDVMPLAETLRTLRMTDAIRKAGGVVYPQDE